MDNKAYHQVDQEHYLQTFKRYPIAFDHGKGARIWDVEGREYIDALAGIAVNNVGHCHPKVVEAIKQQADKLLHISNFFVSKPQVDLSKKLTEITGIDRVFLTNSGAESVEGAIKIARKYAHQVGRGGDIISMDGSFHGRTMATIATGRRSMQEGFDPIPGGFRQVPFNDLDAVKNSITQEVGAILVEPIQGEGGINVASDEFLKGLRQLCDEHNIVLIFDEIQCGMGRSGKWFAKDHVGVQPDIMTLAKGLGGGVPIGAVLSNQKVSDAINFGDHGTTFGGNPLVCAASLATIAAIEEEGLLQQATENGKWFTQELEALNEPSLQRIKGKGLMLGLEFNFETKPLALEMLHAGVLVNATAGNILRIVPPLNITREELGKVKDAMVVSLEKVKAHA